MKSNMIILAVLSCIFLGGCENLRDKVSGGADHEYNQGLNNIEFAKRVRRATGVYSTKLSDQDVQKIARWVVETILLDDPQRQQFHADWHPYLPRFFDAYMWMSPADKYGAFCQKSALSVSETLVRLGVKSRQIHGRRNDTGTGDHQFLQYENPITGKWIVLDPYYGHYYELNGHRMSREEMEAYTAAGGSAYDIRVVYFDWGLPNPGTKQSIDGQFWDKTLEGGLGYLSIAQDEARIMAEHP